jgi:hypothetical protein
MSLDIKSYFQSELAANGIDHIDLDAVLAAKPRGFSVGEETVAGVKIKTYGSVPHIEAGLYRLVQSKTERSEAIFNNLRIQLREKFVVPAALLCADYATLDSVLRDILVDQVVLTLISEDAAKLIENIEDPEQLQFFVELERRLLAKGLDIKAYAETQTKELINDQMQLNKLKEAFLCFWLSVRSGEQFGLEDLYGLSEEDVESLYSLQTREMGKRPDKAKAAEPTQTPPTV